MLNSKLLNDVMSDDVEFKIGKICLCGLWMNCLENIKIIIVGCEFVKKKWNQMAGTRHKTYYASIK